MIKRLLCKMSKKGHKISTHSRRCLKCNKYIPPKEPHMQDVYKVEYK